MYTGYSCIGHRMGYTGYWLIQGAALENKEKKIHCTFYQKLRVNLILKILVMTSDVY